MLKVDITVKGIDITVRNLQAVQKKIGTAVIKALNDTGFAVRAALIEEMPRAFDRPTPYTLKAIYVWKATQARPFVQIGPNPDAGKGTDPSKYLGPEVFGGERRSKRHEKALRYAGILPDNMYTVPGNAAQMDAYGNMSRAQIIQIISWFKGFSDVGYRANATAATKAKKWRGTKRARGFRYFAVTTTKGRFRPGIYKTTRFAFGAAIEPVMIFVKKPVYRKRYQFHKIAEAKAKAVFRELYPKALGVGG